MASAHNAKKRGPLPRPSGQGPFGAWLRRTTQKSADLCQDRRDRAPSAHGFGTQRKKARAVAKTVGTEPFGAWFRHATQQIADRCQDRRGKALSAHGFGTRRLQKTNKILKPNILKTINTRVQTEGNSFAMFASRLVRLCQKLVLNCCSRGPRPIRLECCLRTA
eukprot:5224185-Lingulodinium_polyedra.AAC.1